MDFELPAEHQLLHQTVRDFCRREVEPVVEEHEREHRFPGGIVAMLGRMGLLGIPYSEEEGGAGLDTLAYAVAIEELSRTWGSLGLIVAAHTSLGCGPIHLAGNDEQKERYLVPMAQGRVIGAFGLTEPEAGSDSGGTKTTARREGDDWILDGRKRFITNAGQAGTYVVTARTGTREGGGPAIDAFIVEAGTPG
ncbi:MAG TPA: acyl-CoA dehydrogenase family protein, partial [Candidatus Limnocylindrales bacterium]|nr:acyl-CoA dehydrogenase family protein [Candidatus Limnocylindrales bacterium]